MFMQGVHEKAFSCPYCAAPVTVLIDTSVAEQTYIEDCEVCCRPTIIRYRVEDGEVVELRVKREDE